VLLLIEALQALLDHLGAELDVEGVLGDLLGARHFCRTPRKHALVAPEEVDELSFLFGVYAGPNLNNLGGVISVNLHNLRILDRFKGIR
jgi:hypothetical protein